MTRTLTLVPSSGHLTDIQTCDSNLFGRSHRPECICGFVGGAYRNRIRAEAAAREHIARHVGNGQ